MLRRLLLLASLPIWAASFAQADIVDDCIQATDADLRVSGCTGVIESGDWTGTALAPAHFNRAIAYHFIGDYILAIRDYDVTLQLDPGKTSAYVNRGNAYDDLGKYDQAIADYSQALILSPGHAIAYNNRGNTYRSLQQYDNAVRDWEAVLKIEGRTKIVAWQEYLKEKGYYHLWIDGVYGPGTRGALFSCAADPDC